MKIADLLHAPAGPGRAFLSARVALDSREAYASAFEKYLNILQTSLTAITPVFDSRQYADTFQAAASDGQWLAISLMTNAQREGDGATRLWSLASCCSDPAHRALLKRHAVDESRHALAYLALLDTVFPGSVTPQFRAELESLSPKFSMDQMEKAVAGSAYAHPPTIDDFIQMNIAEIRTTIHHLMQRSALEACCPPPHWPRAQKILDSLLRDELDHVGYTGVIIDQEANSGTDLDALYKARLSDFNNITLDELDQLIFD